MSPDCWASSSSIVVGSGRSTTAGRVHDRLGNLDRWRLHGLGGGRLGRRMPPPARGAPRRPARHLDRRPWPRRRAPRGAMPRPARGGLHDRLGDLDAARLGAAARGASPRRPARRRPPPRPARRPRRAGPPRRGPPAAGALTTGSATSTAAAASTSASGVSAAEGPPPPRGRKPRQRRPARPPGAASTGAASVAAASGAAVAVSVSVPVFSGLLVTPSASVICGSSTVNDLVSLVDGLLPPEDDDSPGASPGCWCVGASSVSCWAGRLLRVPGLRGLRILVRQGCANAITRRDTQQWPRAGASRPAHPRRGLHGRPRPDGRCAAAPSPSRSWCAAPLPSCAAWRAIGSAGVRQRGKFLVLDLAPRAHRHQRHAHRPTGPGGSREQALHVDGHGASPSVRARPVPSARPWRPGPWTRTGCRRRRRPSSCATAIRARWARSTSCPRVWTGRWPAGRSWGRTWTTPASTWRRGRRASAATTGSCTRCSRTRPSWQASATPTATRSSGRRGWGPSGSARPWRRRSRSASGAPAARRWPGPSRRCARRVPPRFEVQARDFLRVHLKGGRALSSLRHHPGRGVARGLRHHLVSRLPGLIRRGGPPRRSPRQGRASWLAPRP